MALSRSTRLIAAWMVVGASVFGLRTEAASPPSDCVRTTIGPVVVNVPSVGSGRASSSTAALPGRPGGLGRDHALGERPEPALRRAAALARPDAPAAEISPSGARRLRRLLLLAKRQPDPDGTSSPASCSASRSSTTASSWSTSRWCASPVSSGTMASRSPPTAASPAQPAARGWPRRRAARRPPALAFRRPRDPWPLLLPLRMAGRPTIPRNQRATVGSGSRAGKGPASLVLDVPSVAQDFDFLHNGAPFPQSEFERGDWCWPVRAATRCARLDPPASADDPDRPGNL